MKRRNADCGKMIRRPIKRNRTESMHSNTFLYMKFLILWAIVIIADFMLEFRFEFLWPFWLLLRSVHDSFKYKGLAFSVLFVCIAITSDLICLFFIPVHWLFFAASTYVWVQYVWHTDKGICLPTIILWMLFVYLEAAIRWKDSRHMPHLDLCRPFAAHCIGYPVVSLGFGFKSYVGHLMRIRKQREVAKENEFYMQLLQQALPQLPTNTTTGDEQQQTVCLPDDEANTTTTAANTQLLLGNGRGGEGSSSNSSSSSSNGIQTLNGDIGCIGASASSSLVGGLGALTGELIRDLIATTASITQHFSERAFNRGGNNNNNHNNAQTTTNSSSSSNKALSLGGNSTGATTTSTSNGHAVGVSQNGSSSSSGGGGGASGNLQSTNNNHNNSHKDRANALQQCSTNGTVVSNGGVRKQSHNNGGGGAAAATASEKESSNKCDINSSHKGSYQASASGNGGATAMMSAALLLGVGAAGSGQEKQQMGGSRDKDYAAMNGGGGGGTSSGGKAGNEYHQQQQQQPPPSQSKENIRLATGSNQLSLSNGTLGAAPGDKGTSGDSTNHIASASVASISLSSSHLGLATEGGGAAAGATKRMNGPTESVAAESHVMVNGNGGGGGGGEGKNGGSATEKTKGKKNRSKQKQEEDRQLSLMQICTSCSRLEVEVKRLKGDVSHVKQIENELKQRTDTNANLKSNLQAKNKEAEELDKKIHELTVLKQSDRQLLNSLEQRLGYEQRQRKQLETVLGNERKLRIKAEEKAAKCYSEIASIDEKKKSAELQNRSYEVEMRKMENELRNRDSEEVLLQALKSMQDKTMSLEKSLSCETRFKLDLFSALGEARRQIELKDGLIGKQMDEITDLKAKIAQLVAIMPIMPISPTRPESVVGYHHTSPSAATVLRLSNGSPLLVNSSQDMNNNGNERSMKMLGQSPQSQQMFMQQQQQQMHQLAQQQQQQGASNLDPNARAYTPVNTNSEGV